jgi:hypothetical protein
VQKFELQSFFKGNTFFQKKAPGLFQQEQATAATRVFCEADPYIPPKQERI